MSEVEWPFGKNNSILKTHLGEEYKYIIYLENEKLTQFFGWFLSISHCCYSMLYIIYTKTKIK